jgi:hypothetical protein
MVGAPLKGTRLKLLLELLLPWKREIRLSIPKAAIFIDAPSGNGLKEKKEKLAIEFANHQLLVKQALKQMAADVTRLRQERDGLADYVDALHQKWSSDRAIAEVPELVKQAVERAKRKDACVGLLRTYNDTVPTPEATRALDALSR